MKVGCCVVFLGKRPFQSSWINTGVCSEAGSLSLVHRETESPLISAGLAMCLNRTQNTGETFSGWHLCYLKHKHASPPKNHTMWHRSHCQTAVGIIKNSRYVSGPEYLCACAPLCVYVCMSVCAWVLSIFSYQSIFTLCLISESICEVLTESFHPVNILQIYR